ncbi:hypothetical protein VTK73DRAFT_4793 [Phialemonium thermophilum]|uniref:Protein transport protein SEC31 n=1 Tax=Phialemonium thermophilum TaxID=223376 RepID=A0ABR3XYN3_9PEZI
MVRLREIPRTAAFAWSPDTARPLLVTGTRAGAVDADFSDETVLELWDLNLDNAEQGLELKPIASIVTDSRFYDIAWGPPSADHPRGVIAGGLENGSLDLWDADKLISGDANALLSRTTKHSGAIKAVQFNPVKPQLLASAGAKGELFVYDVADVSNPFRLGTAAARSDDIECLAWNRKVPNILATGGSGGFVTVWDLKTKKASLTLNNNRKPVSDIAWDPNNSTKLLTATPDDNTPVIYLWDLRNSNAPERVLEGHTQGVLSLSWCPQDADLLISCGKDNRTLVWNPHTGERFGEFPEVTNWTFLTRFNPHNPHLSATASFDGKITVQTLQNTNPSVIQAATQSNLDGEDFFAKAPTQPQDASFSLPKAPAWYERPVGVSFGYGGKLVTFKRNQTAPGQPRSSTIRISHFSADGEVLSATSQFEESLESGDIAGICNSRLEKATTEEEKTVWQVLQTLNSDDGRSKIIEYLGFGKEDETPKDIGAEAGEETQLSAEKKDESSPSVDQSNGIKGHKKGISRLWTDGEDTEDFLSDLTANKSAKTDNPFHLLGSGNTGLEDHITKALLVGNFARAAEICLDADRVADALVIANCGGKELLEKIQTAYLTKRKGTPSYLRLLGSVVNKNLWDVVYNADLANWKETLVTLCTYADPSEFPDLCEGLGDRIMESGARKDACLCYLVGSKLDKVVGIWIAELEEDERAAMQGSSNDSTFSVHARSLQHFIEKVTVFRRVTQFSDAEKDLTSGWKLAPLYDKYTEYADIIAAQGQLDVARKYLDLLPTHYPAAEVARNRIKLATEKHRQTQPASATRGTSRQAPYQTPSPAVVPGTGPRPPYTQATQPSSVPPAFNPYGPPAAAPFQAPVSSPYAPQRQGYAPSPPPVVGYAPPSGYVQPGPYGAPPKAGPPPSGPPPAAHKSKDAGDWNDVPMVVKPPNRKQTPRAAPITSPFPNQPSVSSPPPTGPYQAPRGAPTPPPPPPKGSAPPRNLSSPTSGPPLVGQHVPRPPSTAASVYAPPPPVGGPVGAAPQVIPRTASPYNAPPSGPPPSNRYAPAPASQQFSQPAATPPLAPPGGAPPPPANSSAAAPQVAQNSPYAQPSIEAASQAGRPGFAPPPAARPPSSGVPAAARATPTPSKARHPPGDRSHIPPNAQRLVNILERDMQRVAAKAPASFAPQVKDTQKRLNLLFDHLNNSELVKEDTIEQLSELAAALEAKNYDTAHRLQVEIQRDKTEECGNWMVGVKRLIGMSKATP